MSHGSREGPWGIGGEARGAGGRRRARAGFIRACRTPAFFIHDRGGLKTAREPRRTELSAVETARQSCLPAYSSTLGGVKNCSLQVPPQTHWGRRLGDCLARFSLLDNNLCVQGCAPQAYIHIRHCSVFPLTNLEGTVPISSIVGGIIPHHSPLLNIESHHTTQGALELSLRPRLAQIPNLPASAS